MALTKKAQLNWTKLSEEKKEKEWIEVQYTMSVEGENEIIDRFDPLTIAKMIWKEEALDEQTEVHMMYSDY